MGQDLPGSSHDPCRDRPSRPSRHDPRNECRQLSPERSCRQSARSGTSANARDNQRLILSVAPRQSNSPVTQIALALSSRRDMHPPAATAEMAILIVAVFPSRLSRNSYEDLNDHETLRHDPLMAVLAGKLKSRRGGGGPGGRQATLEPPGVLEAPPAP